MIVMMTCPENQWPSACIEKLIRDCQNDEATRAKDIGLDIATMNREAVREQWLKAMLAHAIPAGNS